MLDGKSTWQQHEEGDEASGDGSRHTYADCMLSFCDLSFNRSLSWAQESPDFLGC